MATPLPSPRRLILIFFMVCLANMVFAAEPAPTANLYSPGNDTYTTLPLRGSGQLRWRWVLRLYQTSLYLSPAAKEAVNAVPKRLRMDYLRDFSRDDMVRATDLTIGNNIDAATLLALQPSLTQWNALYPAIKAGDYIEFDHFTGGGLSMRHNGTTLGTVVDEGLARALFAIWIGPNPVSRDLRDKLVSLPLRK